ncbi:MAG: transcriptional repressor [Nitrospirae bacterium]|nr:transcriptional repressor [Nitrospirota bacterium]
MNTSEHNTGAATLLRAHGLRVTPQRLAICGRLLTRHRHATPQQLFEELTGAFPSLSPNTVYLTLSQLETAGLVRRLHVGGQVVFDSNTTRHDHLYCRHCRRVTDWVAQGADLPPPRVAGWTIDAQSRILAGTCPDCAAR